MSVTKIRILIAEDDTILRRTMVELLELEDDFDVISDCGDGEQALAHAAVIKPDVVLTDIQMPKMTGIEFTRRLKKLVPECAVIVLTKFGDDENVFAAIKAGANGYMLKDSGLEEIEDAVRTAHAGEGVLSPALVCRVMAEFNRISKSALHNRQLFSELSRREVEVLECIANGLRNSQIADRLSLSEKTVKTHVGAILKKLHVNDRTEAALMAKENGIA